MEMFGGKKGNWKSSTKGTVEAWATRKMRDTIKSKTSVNGADPAEVVSNSVAAGHFLGVDVTAAVSLAPDQLAAGNVNASVATVLAAHVVALYLAGRAVSVESVEPHNTIVLVSAVGLDTESSLGEDPAVVIRAAVSAGDFGGVRVAATVTLVPDQLASGDGVTLGVLGAPVVALHLAPDGDLFPFCSPVQFYDAGVLVSAVLEHAEA